MCFIFIEPLQSSHIISLKHWEYIWIASVFLSLIKLTRLWKYDMISWNLLMGFDSSVYVGMRFGDTL